MTHHFLYPRAWASGLRVGQVCHVARMDKVPDHSSSTVMSSPHTPSSISAAPHPTLPFCLPPFCVRSLQGLGRLGLASGGGNTTSGSRATERQDQQPPVGDSTRREMMTNVWARTHAEFENRHSEAYLPYTSDGRGRGARTGSAVAPCLGGKRKGSGACQLMQCNVHDGDAGPAS